ncbi:RNA-directed DNA polymerase [Alishewanella sp. HL-SH05]|uniref:RNA-directed DNA polymerase n=1 Tax=Alishewanella sp. HL-SH05 TaxID=3461145 RepID=UPI004041DA03
MQVTLEQLILAWRKAKVDLYYSTNPPLLAIADYEDKLLDNLTALQTRINGADEDWITEKAFLGDWTLAPKAIKTKDKPECCSYDNKETSVIFASPEEDWTNRITTKPAQVAEFRLMALCSIDFHVLSALWMLEVGHLFDQKLTDNVYGSRLRRNRHNEINPMALGSFKPYLKPFRDWRDGAIKAMRSALTEKKKVIALTADVSSFYHELNAGFMLSASFLAQIGINLSEQQTKLHQLFITALQAWAKNTPLEKGLPVGLPASAVVANTALIKLDQFISQQVVPLYYGRYVDDILLVMENTSNLKQSADFWQWVINRDGGNDLLALSGGAVKFKPDYLQGDRIVFENSKNKLFVLSGEPGTALVNAITEQINQRASEWRSLPVLPENPQTIATDLLKATNHAGEYADNLRKTDALSLSRAGFALNLRNYEAYERDLPPSAWQEQRHAFFNAVINHLLAAPTFFEQAPYLPRIVRMAAACEDFEHLGAMLHRLKLLADSIENDCTHQIKAGLLRHEQVKPEVRRWRVSLAQSLLESIVCALPPTPGRQFKHNWQRFIESHWLRLGDEIIFAPIKTRVIPHILPELQKLQAKLFSHDLAHMPLRFCGLPKEMISQRGIPKRQHISAASWPSLPNKALEQGINCFATWFKPKLKQLPPGLFFATRPFSLNELYLLAPSPFDMDSQTAINQAVMALRGFDINPQRMPVWHKHKRLLQIPDDEANRKPKHAVAVASWLTSDESYVAAAMNKPCPDSRKRYQRMNRLINELISRPDHASYLLLPELAMPPQWFMRVAAKLHGRRISLIAGIEYLHAPKKRVHNQVWASLTHDGFGFPSLLLYRQDKQTPALHEEAQLHDLAGLNLSPQMPWQTPPVIQHGDFYFATLICSELTNIHYRSALRGKIDALFVPEWNPDIETFNALVESSALDIHAYIIQSNNRKYGDSRIRAPAKDSWARDILRVKGGNHDYCITGEIDVAALRAFQSSHRSPEKPFKPVPDGFNQDMAHARKVIPKGEQA